MNVEKFIKKDIRFSLIFIMIGIVAGITGFIFDYQKGIMSGMTIGFLPTGIVMLVLYKYALKKPEMRKNIELEKEERNIFINTKAGYTAFWLSYFYIFISIILYNTIKIPFLHFLKITIIFMPVAYFSLVIYYHKKY
jgi:hypothetical protein